MIIYLLSFFSYFSLSFTLFLGIISSFSHFVPSSSTTCDGKGVDHSLSSLPLSSSSFGFCRGLVSPCLRCVILDLRYVMPGIIKTVVFFFLLFLLSLSYTRYYTSHNHIFSLFRNFLYCFLPWLLFFIVTHHCTLFRLCFIFYLFLIFATFLLFLFFVFVFLFHISLFFLCVSFAPFSQLYSSSFSFIIYSISFLYSLVSSPHCIPPRSLLPFL